ncbi:MAG: S-layer homology domain-containing protein [Clostridiales bacterium]|nr:S-layer homology domain-containing protein [Clostridiales bacterium]
MRKICIMFSIVTILLSGASFAEMGNVFSDISETHWAKSSVDHLYGLEIISGYPDGTFKPENNVKINEFILLTIKSLGYHFESMSADWAKPYIDKAIELGIIENKEFPQYTADITREQMASIVVNALSLNEIRPSNAMDLYVRYDMKDYHLVDDYYKQNVIDSYKYGIVKGYPDGTFNPSGLAKRSEASRVLVTMLKAEERLPYENVEAKSTLMPEWYKGEDGKDTTRMVKFYAPIFNGEPVNELAEIGEHLVNVQDQGKGYLELGYNTFSQTYNALGYRSKAFYDGIFDAPTLMEQSFLYSERRDFSFKVTPMELAHKYRPYSMTLWKKSEHMEANETYEHYFLTRYEAQIKPIFEILFEDESDKAWSYFMTGIKHTGEWSKIEETINGRTFYIGYSKSGITLSFSLKQ